MLVPDIHPNPRDDLYAVDGNFGDVRRTVYSGRLDFGAAGQRSPTWMDYTGSIWLPDSLAYDQRYDNRIRIGTDVWVQGVHEHLLIPAAEARLSPDPRQPAVAFVQLTLTVQGHSQAIVGYRVTVTAGRDAIA